MPARWQEFCWHIPHSMELCLLWEQGLGVISEPCAEALVCQMSPSVPPAAATGRAPIAQGLAPILPRPGSFGLEAVLPIPSAAAQPSLARGAVPPAQPAGRPKRQRNSQSLRSVLGSVGSSLFRRGMA